MRSDDPAHQGELPEFTHNPDTGQPLQRHADGLDNIEHWLGKSEKKNRIRMRAEDKKPLDERIGNAIASATAILIAAFFLAILAALIVKGVIIIWGIIL